MITRVRPSPALELLLDYLIAKGSPECMALVRYWYRNFYLDGRVSLGHAVFSKLRLRMQGSFTRYGMWLPYPKEVCDCCKQIRLPSARYPLSLLRHVSTMLHCCQLDGADVRTVRTAHRYLNRPLHGDWSEMEHSLENALAALGFEKAKRLEIITLISIIDGR